MFFIFILFVLFILFIVIQSKKTNEEIRNYGHSAGHDWEDMMDAVMFHEDICDGSCGIFEEEEFHPETLNPYEMEIMDMVYLDEEGELIDDL